MEATGEFRGIGIRLREEELIGADSGAVIGRRHATFIVAATLDAYHIPPRGTCLQGPVPAKGRGRSVYDSRAGHPGGGTTSRRSRISLFAGGA